MLMAGKLFAAQLSTNAALTDFFYIFSTMGGFLGILALALLDAGTVSPRNLLDTMLQKLVSALIAGTAFMLVGYGIWNWQFDQAYGIPNPLMQSISDWWIGGPNLRTYAQNIDPTILPGADTLQIFVVFFFTYAALIGSFIHSIGLERMKPSACYILSAVAGGLLMPILTYLTWGPVGPLTKLGLHDFVGAYSLYMFVGIWSVILTSRLGARPAVAETNPALLGAGAILLMIAIPVFVVGCGFLVPGQGYFGISDTTSGLGIVFINIAVSFGGGILSGAYLAYSTRKPIHAFLGPIAGYVGCTALFDIAAPWQCLLVGFASPFVAALFAKLTAAARIHDQKIIPLALGPSIFSVLLAGIICPGRPTGGLAGLTGDFAFQHAHISLAMQAIGVIVTIVFSAITGLILTFLLEKSGLLRISKSEEQAGLDATYWAGSPKTYPAAETQAI